MSEEEELLRFIMEDLENSDWYVQMYFRSIRDNTTEMEEKLLDWWGNNKEL